MEYHQINLTGQEIDERLQNVGTPADNPDANGTLFARQNKNVDDIDELSDAVLHIQDAQKATDKTVTQHTENISTLQTAVGDVKKDVEKNASAIGNADDPNDAKGSLYARVKKANASTDVNRLAITTLSSANKKNQADITDIDSRQTNIEQVVSGAQQDAYFSLLWLNFVFNNSYFGNIDNVKVRLYRWSGKRYAQFEMFTRNNTGVSQELIGYEIILKQEQKDGINVRVPYIHYNDDGTEEELWLAVKNAFGGRISYNRYKKRRWRIQAFLNNKPITAPFDFRASIDHNGYVSLTKGGMMRSVPATSEVIYDGSYNGDKWRQSTKGHTIDFHFCDALGIKFPRPGDKVSEISSYGSCGSVVSVKEDIFSTSILWIEEGALYNIRAKYNDTLGFLCASPAKKLCDDIYDYASKMSSGTLRDLYVSAGAVYNEQTGYYELNGLTDITEEQMRTIWQEDLSGWYQKGRTNLTRNISVKGNTGGYNGGIDITCICINNKNLQVFNLGADCFARYMDSAFRECSNLETIDTRFRVVPYDTSLGINTFRGCIKLKDVRFNNHYLRMKATLNLYDSPLISKESVLSAITTTDNASATSAGFLTITLHADAYARLKDDADIIAALEAKNGVVTLVSA